MPFVLGIDSSTQSTKALLVDAETGEVQDERRAAHPEGTEVDPRAWLDAVDEAAGPLLERAEALAVGGQQHGMVLLDEHGGVVRDALLWNDTRSAPQAQALIEEMGGPEQCVGEIGSLMVASFTASKLRWVRDNEPDSAARARSVMLPHDYVSRHLAGGGDAFTDRGDASGTGYYSTRAEAWAPELAERALGHALELPRLPSTPQEVMARTPGGAAIAAGTGDNMGAALGLSLGPGDVSVSIGTSGVCAMVTDVRPDDASGTVTGFADATGRFLPMTTTINASRILEAGRALLGVDHEELSRLALASEPGAGGVTLLPYFDGERTPNRPTARATLTGMSASTTREDVARAYVEGLLCSLADGIAALEDVTGTAAARIVLIGGGARSRAVQELAPAVFGREVEIAPSGEYVALGAARQAAWALASTDEPPHWEITGSRTVGAEATPQVLAAYRELKERTEGW
ncbi:xylulokinase [Helcobacillus sp. ACRRO]|uniref:xylulokinase n=1 Tax=Helcobacillus TaxID=1161125 RepID=UPI001EF6BD48|nr:MULTISPECIES: xylulokinase [Helcobacillus]MCG7426831.1 xylulokinase [Helcobacillus sp. ACRRO]MDK7742056.1 xylulokinase [Helcobacillus massiliensis]WOO93611.1 xylulokinase [Helcobacillus massiliensis]